MSMKVSTIRNLGPAIEDAFAAIGLTSAQDLRDLGADRAYAKLLNAGHRPHFIAYYALVMGLQGRPWNDCRGAEKVALRQRFDKLVATSKPSPASKLAQSLDKVGVRLEDLPEAEEAT